MKRNVHSSCCELKASPRQCSRDSTSLLARPAVTVSGLDGVSDFNCATHFSIYFPLSAGPSANQHAKRRQRPMSCRQFGVIRSWGTLWPRTAGTRATSRYRTVISHITQSFVVVIQGAETTQRRTTIPSVKYLNNRNLFSQPTVTATPKATKNGKPGYDDTTLPLMEKNQGQSVCVCCHLFLFKGLNEEIRQGQN